MEMDSNSGHQSCLNLQNKWSHSNGVTKKGCGWYSCCATGKELKLSGSQGMYVVFAKDDQGSGLGQIVRWSVWLWKRYAWWFQKGVKNGSWWNSVISGLGDALEVEDGMCVQRLFGFWLVVPGFGCEQKVAGKCSTWGGVDQVLERDRVLVLWDFKVGSVKKIWGSGLQVQSQRCWGSGSGS